MTNPQFDVMRERIWEGHCPLCDKEIKADFQHAKIVPSFRGNQKQVLICIGHPAPAWGSDGSK